MKAEVSIDGTQVVSPEKPVKVAKADVFCLEPTLFSASDASGCAEISAFSDLTATCTFKAKGRFEAVASATLKVIQSDSLAELFSTDSSSLLAGAIQASAAYSFAFEPVRALEGMTRRFEIGSVTVEIEGVEPKIVPEFPYSFPSPIEVVKPLITSRPPIKAVGFAHEGMYVIEPGKSVGESLEVVFPKPFPENNLLNIFWTPFLVFEKNKALVLPETARKIRPNKLSDLIMTRISLKEPKLLPGEKTDVSFFYGPKDGTIDHQGSIFLENKDYFVTLKVVEWYANGTKFGSASATTQFSKDKIGSYSISASATFSVIPQEDEEFESYDVCEGSPVWAKVIGGLRIRNLTAGGGIASTPTKLSYREKLSSEHIWLMKLGKRSWCLRVGRYRWFKVGRLGLAECGLRSLIILV